jgi:acetyl-CoA synthetase
MSEIYPVSDDWKKKAFVTAEGYNAAYAQSVGDPDTFWREEAKRLDWITPFTNVKNTSFHEADFGIKWFEDGALNVSSNCIDRHLP